MSVLTPDIIEISETSIEDLINHKIIILDDNFNTFEWVIECLVKYCDHKLEQAEQCAYIIHHNGKCSVKNGTKQELQPIKDALVDAGLSAIIE